jgi:hypothetical protein
MVIRDKLRTDENKNNSSSSVHIILSMSQDSHFHSFSGSLSPEGGCYFFSSLFLVLVTFVVPRLISVPVSCGWFISSRYHLIMLLQLPHFINADRRRTTLLPTLGDEKFKETGSQICGSQTPQESVQGMTNCQSD